MPKSSHLHPLLSLLLILLFSTGCQQQKQEPLYDGTPLQLHSSQVLQLLEKGQDGALLVASLVPWQLHPPIDRNRFLERAFENNKPTAISWYFMAYGGFDRWDPSDLKQKEQSQIPLAPRSQILTSITQIQKLQPENSAPKFLLASYQLLNHDPEKAQGILHSIDLSQEFDPHWREIATLSHETYLALSLNPVASLRASLDTSKTEQPYYALAYFLGESQDPDLHPFMAEICDAMIDDLPTFASQIKWLQLKQHYTPQKETLEKLQKLERLQKESLTIPWESLTQKQWLHYYEICLKEGQEEGFVYLKKEFDRWVDQNYR